MEVQVQSMVSESTFIVADTKDHVLLDTSQSPQQCKNISVGKCYRLLFPEICDNVLTFAEKYKPGPVAKFDGARLTAAVTKRCIPKELEAKDIKIFSEVCNVKRNTTVGVLYMMVVFMSALKRGKYSLYRTVKVKDRTGDKHWITLFGTISEDLKLGNVYKFMSVVVQDYRGEGETLGRMKSAQNTRIVPATKEVLSFFADVSIADCQLNGTILAHETVSKYECCVRCSRSKFRGIVTEEDGSISQGKSDKCVFCGHPIDENVKMFDCHIILMVAQNGTMDVFKVSAFKGHFEMDVDKMSNEEIEEELIKIHMRNVVVDYDMENEMDKIKAIKIKVCPIEESAE